LTHLERRHEVDATLNPCRERRVASEAFRVDDYEAGQRPAGEFHRPHVRLGQRPLTRIGPDANHQISAGDAAAHAAVHDEGETSDHSLLGDVTPA